MAAAQALVDGPLLRQSTAELVTLRTAIPDQVRMSQILRQLSKASADAQVRIIGITPQPPTPVGVADVVAMSVTIEGRYFAIREFLRLLRSRADVKAGQGAGLGTALCDRLDQFTGGAARAAA